MRTTFSLKYMPLAFAVWDLQIRKSMAWVKPRFPYVLGSDGSGIVVAIGASVTRFKVGDAVYGYCWDNLKGGFYAEYVSAPSDCIAKLPRGISLEAAGALGASGLTALSGVDRALNLKRGDNVIIHGASGAVGTLAVQLAKLRGARVLATASGEEGVALVRRLGADVAIDGRTGRYRCRGARVRAQRCGCGCWPSRAVMRWKMSGCASRRRKVRVSNRRRARAEISPRVEHDSL
jgi:NADPH:quinone reductase-like Zn-dependent oxidoreductase